VGYGSYLFFDRSCSGLSDQESSSGQQQRRVDRLINAFVTELNSTLSGLVYSTYLGGSGFSFPFLKIAFADAATGIRLNPSGNVYITGATASSNFPHPASGNIGCYKDKPGLGSVFLVKLNHA
jgi:hypothetical protein